MYCECEICGDDGEAFEDYRHYCWACHDKVKEALNPVDDWQPIETVPHNTKVLVWRSGSPAHSEYLTSAWYGQSSEDYSPRWHNYTDGPFAFHPTHWMSLPAAPEEV